MYNLKKKKKKFKFIKNMIQKLIQSCIKRIFLILYFFVLLIFKESYFIY
jgi:hypothetical protein